MFLWQQVLEYTLKKGKICSFTAIPLFSSLLLKLKPALCTCMGSEDIISAVCSHCRIFLRAHKSSYFGIIVVWIN